VPSEGHRINAYNADLPGNTTIPFSPLSFRRNKTAALLFYIVTSHNMKKINIFITTAAVNSGG